MSPGLTVLQQIQQGIANLPAQLALLMNQQQNQPAKPRKPKKKAPPTGRQQARGVSGALGKMGGLVPPLGAVGKKIDDVLDFVEGLEKLMSLFGKLNTSKTGGTQNVIPVPPTNAPTNAPTSPTVPPNPTTQPTTQNTNAPTPPKPTTTSPLNPPSPVSGPPSPSSNIINPVHTGVPGIVSGAVEIPAKTRVRPSAKPSPSKSARPTKLSKPVGPSRPTMWERPSMLNRPSPSTSAPMPIPGSPQPKPMPSAMGTPQDASVETLEAIESLTKGVNKLADNIDHMQGGESGNNQDVPSKSKSGGKTFMDVAKSVVGSSDTGKKVLEAIGFAETLGNVLKIAATAI